MRTLSYIFLGAALALAGVAQSPPAPLAQVNAALQAGEADKALQLLASLPLTEADLGEAHNLKCRVFFTLEQWDGAVSECEQAVKADGQNSGYRLWLGRALGEKANRASFLTAYSLSKRVRAEFEEAVRLNPRNAEALADLADFYEQAPGVVGGGLDKAEGVAAQMEKVDATRGHDLRGHIAEQRRDFSEAERQFRQAIAVSAHPAFQWVTLASFLARKARWSEMELAEHNALNAAARDKHAGVALFDGASILTRVNREPARLLSLLNHSPNQSQYIGLETRSPSRRNMHRRAISLPTVTVSANLPTRSARGAGANSLHPAQPPSLHFGKNCSHSIPASFPALLGTEEWQAAVGQRYPNRQRDPGRQTNRSSAAGRQSG